MKLLRPALGFLTVMTLALTPAVSPVGPFVDEAQAAPCTPSENVVSGKQVLTFTNSTSCTWTPPEGVSKVDYLIVAGDYRMALHRDCSDLVGSGAWPDSHRALLVHQTKTPIGHTGASRLRGGKGPVLPSRH